MKEPALHFLVGPTAVGKTEVAHVLAALHARSILSVDSMMVYRGMSIGTAKPAPADIRRFHYGGIDLVDPSRSFNVAGYLAAVRPMLEAARAPGRAPLAVGGSGLYVQALIHGLADGPPADTALRAYWTGQYETRGVAALQAEVNRLSPDVFRRMPDPQNPRRLIRAIEAITGGGTRQERTWRTGPEPAPVVGLRMDSRVLNWRIELRVKAMYGQGLVEETRELRARCGELSVTARHAIGYAEALAVLDGGVDLSGAMERTVVRTRQLAKRQRTWFRHQLNIHWVDVDDSSDTETVAARVQEAWDRYGATQVRIGERNDEEA